MHQITSQQFAAKLLSDPALARSKALASTQEAMESEQRVEGYQRELVSIQQRIVGARMTSKQVADCLLR